MGSKKGKQGQEGMNTVPRAGDGYGPEEHRLMGYDRERLGGDLKNQIYIINDQVRYTKYNLLLQSAFLTSATRFFLKEIDHQRYRANFFTHQ